MTNPQPFEDLNDEENETIWQEYMCKFGMDRIRARRAWEAEQKVIEAMNKQYSAREWKANGNEVDEETEEELEQEEAELEQPPEGWEWKEVKGEMKLRPTADLQEKWDREEKLNDAADKKLEILEKIEKKLDDDNAIEEAAKLPENVQKQYQQTVQEAEKELRVKVQTKEQELTAQLIEKKKQIESQLEALYQKKLAELDIRMQEAEQKAQAKVDERLKEGLAYVDEHLIHPYDGDFVKEFADILAQIEADPEHNAEWEIRLFATSDGNIEMLKGNNTRKEVSERAAISPR